MLAVYSGHAMAATARQARAVIIRGRLLRLVALIVAIPAEHVLSASCALHPLHRTRRHVRGDGGMRGMTDETGNLLNPISSFPMLYLNE